MSNEIVKEEYLTLEQEQKILEQGLNEYIDPSQAPIYNQEYVQITYKQGKQEQQNKLEKELPKKEGKEEATVYYEDNSSDSLGNKKTDKKVKQLSINLTKEEREQIEQKQEEYGVEKITYSNNKELMDIIYPGKESIDKLNQEIIDERKQIIAHEKEQGKKIKKNEVQALKLSNHKGLLLMYSSSNINVGIDLIGNGEYSGNEVQIYSRNSTSAQDWYFNDLTGEIKPNQGSNLCLEVAGGQYYNGTRIQLHYCNGNIAQKWETWPDRSIRSQGAKWLCLDAKNGISSGNKIQGWTCDTANTNQRFLVGENDFSQTSLIRYIRIHAKNTWDVNQFPGHALISVGKRNYNNKQCWTTNSFSNWPSNDTNDTNDNGKTNNIKTNNNIEVDRNEDWSEAISGSTTYRKRDLSITKQTYDEIKYMNGYYAYSKDFWNDSVWGYGPTHCATFSRDLWNKYTGEWVGNGYLTPGDIYNSIYWYNETTGPFSKCSKGY